MTGFVGPLPGEEPFDPELERAIEEDEGDCSEPPDGAEPKRCSAHDKPLMTVVFDDTNPPKQVFECGCEVLL